VFTSDELFAKVNPPHKSYFSKCAFSSLKHLQVDLFSIQRVTLINWQPFVKDLAKCSHVFLHDFLRPYHPYYYCKIETKCDRIKLIKILNIFYKHGISCVLVIVHRILREYQN